MKNLKILIAAGMFAVLAGTGVAQGETKIAVIDLDRTFDEYHKTKLADAQLKEQADEFNRERKALVEEYDALQESFDAAREDAQNTALSDEVRDERRNQAEQELVELREYENKIRRFDQSRKKELDEQSKRMRAGIVEEIKEKLDAHAVNMGYSLVIDNSGPSLNGIPVLLYSAPGMDITDEIIALINQEEN